MRASKLFMNIWRTISLLAALALFSSPRGAIAANDPVDLLLIPIYDDQQLQELANLDLQVFAQVTASNGQTLVLLPASAQQKDALTRNGFAPQTLGVWDSQAGQTLFMLYGLPADLSQAERIVPLLWMDGRYAIMQGSIAQADQVSLLGIQRLPLELSPLSIPVEKDGSVLALAAPQAITPSAQVQAMLAQVSQSALYTSVGNLSGEWPVLINNSPYTLLTRYTYTTTPITKATRLAYENFQAMGLTSWYDYYYIGSGQYRNVLAQQTGLTQPERVFMLTAHLDSYSPSGYSLAPGADDNASGSAALLAIANILRQYQFGCTLRYALFTGEEQGLYGSKAYAQDPDPGNIQSVLNLDMLGYNTLNTAPTIELHTRFANSNDLAIANLFKDAVSAYQIALTPLILQDGLSFSDNYLFWAQGYPAILAIEDWSDHTPYYHTTSDQLKSLNMPYYTQFTKAALATFAHMGCLLGQLSGTVQNAANGAPIAGATVVTRLDALQAWSTTTLADGSYKLSLPFGLYSVQVTANGYLAQTMTNIQISNAQTTNLNFSLQSCIPLQSTNFTISNSFPMVGETVVFSASSGGQLPISYSWTYGDGSVGAGPVVSHAYGQKGAYVVQLAASNICSSALVSKVVGVETTPVYLPLLNHQD